MGCGVAGRSRSTNRSEIRAFILSGIEGQFRADGYPSLRFRMEIRGAMLTSIAKYAKLTGLVKGIVLGVYNPGSYPMEKAGGKPTAIFYG
tara:strand:+ start:18 stop:287 length:270 start_codon:yes stop_codon:yes gene_type:complete